MSKHGKVDILPDEDYHWDLARSGNIEARNYIVEYHMPLVHQVVHSLMRKLPHNIEKDDLLGYGSFGLIKAAETYDPSKGKFVTHAAFRINNAIYDGLRKEDWAPKSMRRNLKDIEQARAQLFTEFRKEPTNEEIADFIGKDEAWVVRLRNIEEAAKPVFLSATKTGEDPLGEIEQLLSDTARYETEEVNQTNFYQEKFVEWLGSIDDNLKVLWYVLYFIPMSPRECREFLGLSVTTYTNLRKRLTESFLDFLKTLQETELDTTGVA